MPTAPHTPNSIKDFHAQNQEFSDKWVAGFFVDGKIAGKT
jgi:hypothetical protein